MTRCKALLKNGKRCGNFIKGDEEYCFQHIHIERRKQQMKLIKKATMIKRAIATPHEYPSFTYTNLNQPLTEEFIKHNHKVNEYFDREKDDDDNEEEDVDDEEDMDDEEPDEEIKFPPYPEIKNDDDENKLFCPYCGTEITETMEKCPFCHANIKKEVKERNIPKKKSTQKRTNKKQPKVVERAIILKQPKKSHDWTQFHENCKQTRQWWKDNRANIVFIVIFAMVFVTNVHYGMVWDGRNNQIKDACKPYRDGNHLSVEQIYLGLSHSFTNLQVLEWNDNVTYITEDFGIDDLTQQIDNILLFIQYFYHPNASIDEIKFFNDLLVTQLEELDSTLDDYYDGSVLLESWVLMILIDLIILLVFGCSIYALLS